MSLQIQIQIQMNMWHFFTFKFHNSSHSLNEPAHREKPLSCPPSTSIKQLLLGRLIIDWHVLLYICTASVVEMCKCMCIPFLAWTPSIFFFTRMIIKPQSKMCSALHIGVHVLCNCLNVQSFEICAKVKKCKSASAVQTLYKFYTALYCVWREVWLCRDFPQS